MEVAVRLVDNAVSIGTHVSHSDSMDCGMK
jgi:hypothetical protein